MDLKADSHYVLSGGMGALGMVTAQYLLEAGAAQRQSLVFELEPPDVAQQ